MSRMATPLHAVIPVTPGSDLRWSTETGIRYRHSRRYTAHSAFSCHRLMKVLCTLTGSQDKNLFVNP